MGSNGCSNNITAHGGRGWRFWGRVLLMSRYACSQRKQRSNSPTKHWLLPHRTWRCVRLFYEMTKIISEILVCVIIFTFSLQKDTNIRNQPTATSNVCGIFMSWTKEQDPKRAEIQLGGRNRHTWTGKWQNKHLNLMTEGQTDTDESSAPQGRLSLHEFEGQSEENLHFWVQKLRCLSICQ